MLEYSYKFRDSTFFIYYNTLLKKGLYVRFKKIKIIFKCIFYLTITLFGKALNIIGSTSSLLFYELILKYLI